MSNDTLRQRLEDMRKRAVEVRANNVGIASHVASGFADGLLAAIAELDKHASPTPNGDKWAVLVGNPLKGISVHGPFQSHADAEAWGDRHAARAEFWLAPLVTHPLQSGPVLAVDNKPEKPVDNSN